MNDVNINILTMEFGDSLKPFSEKVTDSLEPVFLGFKGIFYYVFQKPIKYEIIKRAEIKQFAESTRKKSESIPNGSLNLSNINQVGKILDDSIFQLSIKDFRELYSSLIVACVDRSKTVKPFYSSILKEMSSDEANLLNYFFEYNFLYEINISSDNPYFIKENTYKFFWKPKYFKINQIKEHDYLREFESKNWENIHDDSKFFEANVSESFNFLVSKNIIKEDPSSQWDEFIPSIRRYAFENDEDVKRLKDKNKDYLDPINFDCNHSVYVLTDLGEALKDILTAYNPVVLT